MKKLTTGGKRRIPVTLLILLVSVLAVLCFPASRALLTGLWQEASLNAGRAGEFEAVASAGQIPEQILSQRQNIYDRHFKELAVSFSSASIYARPLKLQDQEDAAGQLAPILGLEPEKLLLRLRAERNFVWLARQIAPSVGEKIASLKLTGVYQIKHLERFYPQQQTAAQVVGFAKEEQGLAGLEFFYDSVLRSGSNLGRQFPGPGVPVADSSGGHLILTLDLELQKQMEKQLDTICRQTGAKSAMGMILSPATGDVLALVNRPGFDPNAFWEFETESQRNRVIDEPLYPAGLSRLFHLAAALEQAGGSFAPAAEELAVSGEAGSAQEVEPVAQHEAKGAKAEKKEKEKKEKYWSLLAPGVYSSPLHWPPVPAPETGPLSAFAGRLGFFEENTLDLPLPRQPESQASKGRENASPFAWDGPESATTMIRLLVAFSRLVSGGQELQPHLLAAIFDAGQNSMKEVRAKKATAAINPDNSRNFVAMLAAAAGVESEQPLLVESLAGPGIYAPNSANDSEDAVVKAAVEALASAAQSGDLPGKSGKHVSKSPEKTVASPFQSVILGMEPAGAPEVVMVVALDQAMLDPAKPSPLRGMGLELLSAGLKISRQPKSALVAQGFPAGREEELYQQWREMKKQDDVASAPGPEQESEQMPDVRGFSLRKALQTLDSTGLKIVVTGEGRVVWQLPQPGEAAGGEECRLVLRADAVH